MAGLGLLRERGFRRLFLAGLPAGAWVDRMRRKLVLVNGDLGRAVLIGSVPLA